MVVRGKTYTVAEFSDIANAADVGDKILELIAGEIVEKMPSFTPSHLAIRIARFISNFVEKHDLGYITGPDGGYIISENDVFNPDVGYISKERLPEEPQREVLIPPDLAVEVKSPTDSRRAMQRKAEKYLAGGTRMVLLVFPAKEQSEVHRANVNVQTLGVEDTLDGGEVLPGFKLKVRDIFKK